MKHHPQAAGCRHTESWYRTRGDEVVSPTLLRFAHDRAGARVLDLGSGPGAYSRRLAELDHQMVAVDARLEYARRASVPPVAAAQADGWRLPFVDRAFASVLLFEVLEHVPDPGLVISEAVRVAHHNVLITVPDCEGRDRIENEAITFEHMIDEDHRHFFTPATLRELLEPFGESATVEEGDFLDVNLARLVAGRPAGYAIETLRRLHLYRPRYPSRLFAELRVDG